MTAPLSPRHAELEARMSAAALRYLEVTGARLFVTPIPNTTRLSCSSPRGSPSRSSSWWPPARLPAGLFDHRGSPLVRSPALEW